MHVRARVHINIHKNANARTVGPINELLVVGEYCFWTVSAEGVARMLFGAVSLICEARVAHIQPGQVNRSFSFVGD